MGGRRADETRLVINTTLIKGESSKADVASFSLLMILINQFESSTQPVSGDSRVKSKAINRISF